MGRTACTEPQCLYKGDLYPFLLYTSVVYDIVYSQCVFAVSLLWLTVCPPCADVSLCWRSSCYEDSSFQMFVLRRDRCHQHCKMHTTSSHVIITRHLQMGAETTSRTPRVIRVTQRTMTDDCDDEQLVIHTCSSPLSWLLQPFCFKCWGHVPHIWNTCDKSTLLAPFPCPTER